MCMTLTATSTNNNNQSLTDYIPKNKFPLSGDCPITESEFNWLFKQRDNNGFAKAFVKVSARSFLVHIPSFIECLDAKRGA